MRESRGAQLVERLKRFACFHSGKSAWLILLGLALAVRLLVACLLTGPPYMDAYYYTVGAGRLALPQEGDIEGGSLRSFPFMGNGTGFTEPFLWHYLDDPAGLPRPGFLYWMPLPSILAAPFVALSSPSTGSAPLESRSFLIVQLPFVLLSALLPLVSYFVALQTTGSQRHAWAAGLLTIFSGFFFPYWTLPETFAPFALFGSLALWLAGAGYGMLDTGRWCVVGVLVGLAHLTRADGFLLLPVVVLAPLVLSRPRPHTSPSAERKGRPGQPLGRAQGPPLQRLRATRVACNALPGFFCALVFVILGYLLVMGPWFLRNAALIGAPLSSAGAQTLWLTNYDDLFCYGCDLSPRTYLAWGWDNILHSKFYALWVNFQRLWAEDCLIFLLPFVLIGLYRLWRNPVESGGHKVRPVFILSTVYLVLLYLIHSLAFTFPGWRGGFFHSSGALLPFLLVAGMDGLDATVRWAARRRRGWNVRVAYRVFTTGVVVLAILLSLYVAMSTWPSWRNVGQVYREIEARLARRGVSRDAIVMVGNPPAFWYHARRPAVVVPNGSVEDLLNVAVRYGVEYVVLDQNRPAPLAGLYAGEESNARLAEVASWGETQARVVLYEVR